jgi:hypothetical protein
MIEILYLSWGNDHTEQGLYQNDSRDCQGQGCGGYHCGKEDKREKKE